MKCICFLFPQVWHLPNSEIYLLVHILHGEEKYVDLQWQLNMKTVSGAHLGQEKNGSFEIVAPENVKYMEMDACAPHWGTTDCFYGTKWISLSKRESRFYSLLFPAIKPSLYGILPVLRNRAHAVVCCTAILLISCRSVP